MYMNPDAGYVIMRKVNSDPIAIGWGMVSKVTFRLLSFLSLLPFDLPFAVYFYL
jgi:hypothetical protein